MTQYYHHTMQEWARLYQENKTEATAAILTFFVQVIMTAQDWTARIVHN